jgi:hypothetical protein
MFDIHRLDGLDWDDYEEAFENYLDGLIEHFVASPEGQAHLAAFPEVGHWVGQLLYIGYGYLGVALPQMNRKHVQEIITELFPRKISLLAPEDAADAMPELIAFWEYLGREYRLRQADSIVSLLNKIAPKFEKIMNDPSKFGMAKSLVMMGQQAGFDMTKKEDVDAFMKFYNASILAQDSELSSGSQGRRARGKAKAKRKKKRKAAKAARKRNR